MKISQLIAELEAIRAEHGDMVVAMEYDCTLTRLDPSWFRVRTSAAPALDMESWPNDDAPPAGEKFLEI